MYDLNAVSPSSGEASAAEPDTHGEDESAIAMAQLGLRKFYPHPLLSEIVEDIWDFDIPDGDVARRITIRLPPSACSFLALQYRVPIVSDWTFGEASMLHSAQRHVAVRMQIGIITARPAGPLGAVIVRVKPEVADRFTRAPSSEVLDQKIDLHNFLDRRTLVDIEAALALAPDAAARVAHVENLLLRKMHPVRPARHLIRAASLLRFDPSLSIRSLASQLNVSVRHLSRGFKAAFGTGPKQFARLTRVEKAVAARRDGFDWTDIAHRCGFADQAHLIHDFRAIIGTAPEQMFRPPGVVSLRRLRVPRVPVFFNLFIE